MFGGFEWFENSRYIIKQESPPHPPPLAVSTLSNQSCKFLPQTLHDNIVSRKNPPRSPDRLVKKRIFFFFSFQSIKKHKSESVFLTYSSLHHARPIPTDHPTAPPGESPEPVVFLGLDSSFACLESLVGLLRADDPPSYLPGGEPVQAPNYPFCPTQDWTGAAGAAAQRLRRQLPRRRQIGNRQILQVRNQHAWAPFLDHNLPALSVHRTEEPDGGGRRNGPASPRREP